MENPVPVVQSKKSISRNCPDFINNSQLGFSNAYRFRNDFLKLKLRDLHPTKLYEVKFDFHEFERIASRSYEFTLVSPYDDSFACSWVTGDFPELCSVVGIFHKNPVEENVWREPSDQGYPMFSQQIELMKEYKNIKLMDICHLDNVNNYANSFLSISQHVYTTCSRIQMRPKSRSFNAPQGEYQNSMRMMFHKVWNAAWNSNIQKLSLGTCTGIIYTTLESLFGEVNDIYCPGENTDRFTLPYIQRFNSNGNLLYFGLNDGHVTCLDTRDPGVRFQSDILIRDSVRDLQFLQDGTTMIVGGANDRLCCVDTRMNSILFDYPGHCTEGKKTAFYVNECFELLCSSGRDYVSRYWDLKNGCLLAEVPENFPDKAGMFMYSALQSSGHKLYSYTFCGNKICYRQAFTDISLSVH